MFLTMLLFLYGGVFMECVKLFYKEELMGVLTYKEPQYIFVKNDKFSDKNIFFHMGLKDKNEYYSSHLFTFFYKFIPEKSRVDILEKAGINEEKDSEFEMLKKVASLDLNKNQFWIGW